MRHRHSGRQLNRNSSHRKAMFRNMTASLVEHEIIKTTVIKAKELRMVAEPLITLAKNDSVANRRLAFARLRSKEAVGKLFTDLGPRYQGRPGGYIRILKCGLRAGDKPGELTLFLDPTNRGESSVRILRSSTGSTVRVPAMTLLALVQNEGYERLDAIKLDVEGAEDLILEPFLRDAPQSLWPGLIIIITDCP